MPAVFAWAHDGAGELIVARALSYFAGFWVGGAVFSVFDILVVREISSLGGTGWSMSETLYALAVFSFLMSISFVAGEWWLAPAVQKSGRNTLPVAMIFLFGMLLSAVTFFFVGPLEAIAETKSYSRLAILSVGFGIFSSLIGMISGGAPHSGAPRTRG